MSTQSLCEENTKGEMKSEAKGSVAETLTTEEYAIYNAHREACEVRWLQLMSQPLDYILTRQPDVFIL